MCKCFNRQASFDCSVNIYTKQVLLGGGFRFEILRVQQPWWFFLTSKEQKRAGCDVLEMDKRGGTV